MHLKYFYCVEIVNEGCNPPNIYPYLSVLLLDSVFFASTKINFVETVWVVLRQRWDFLRFSGYELKLGK